MIQGQLTGKTYVFGASTLTLKFGTITSTDAEVLVSSDDHMLTMGGGVSAAIRRAGGEAVILDAAKKVPARVGDVVVTAAGNLAAKYIFHVITLGSDGRPRDSGASVANAMRKCFSLMESLGMRSIAFPALGTGAAGYRYEDVASSMARVAVEAFREAREPLSVTIFFFDRFGNRSLFDYATFFEEFGVQMRSFGGGEVGGQKSVGINSKNTLNVPASVPISERSKLLRDLADLNQERDEVEATLVRLEGGLQVAERSVLERHLDEIAKRRLHVLRQMARENTRCVEAFISYAHADEEYRIQLGKHLKALEHQGLIQTWHDRLIKPGIEWEKKIHERLESSGLILLLVSSDFIDSKYCFDIELKKGLELHRLGRCLVVPIILRPVIWSQTPFAGLQALPKDGKAVSEWRSADAAYVNITEGISVALEDWTANRS